MSPPSFNLVDQPWIPVEDLQGERKEVSVRECFNQADRLSKVIDASPLVTAAVYRLLFAIMQRAVPVRDVEDWQDRWDEQAFQSDVSDYLDRFYHRFDLFDEQLPFAQAVDMPENCRLFPWTKLAMELPPNSSKLLFDHTNTTEPQAASPAEAVRYLCASLAFTVGAGRSCTGYTAHAPLTSALVIIPEGRDLAETLLANLLPSPVNDEPIWERPALSAQDLTSSSLVWTGPASRLTWPSRAIRFLPEEDGAIRWIQFGMGLPTPDIEGDRDPWVAYRVTRDGKRIARKLVPDRMIWRDFHGLLGSLPDEDGEAVEALTRLAALQDAEREAPVHWSVLAAGMAADRASVLAWRQERWSVPRNLVSDGTRMHTLSEAISSAEETANELTGIIRRLVNELLSEGDAKPSAQQVSNLVGSLPGGTTYWTALTADFQSFLRKLAGDVDTARSSWLASQVEAVNAARTAVFAFLGHDARSLRAWAKTSHRFTMLNNKLNRSRAGLSGLQLEVDA